MGSSANIGVRTGATIRSRTDGLAWHEPTRAVEFFLHPQFGMESRDIWKALQAHLVAARARLDAGDRAAALQAVDAALVIDPNFLAAHSMRQQIELDRKTAPHQSRAPVQPPKPLAPPQPLAAPDEDLVVAADTFREAQEPPLREGFIEPFTDVTPYYNYRVASGKSARGRLIAAAVVWAAVTLGGYWQLRSPGFSGVLFTPRDRPRTLPLKATPLLPRSTGLIAGGRANGFDGGADHARAIDTSERLAPRIRSVGEPSARASDAPRSSAVEVPERRLVPTIAPDSSVRLVAPAPPPTPPVRTESAPPPPGSEPELPVAVPVAVPAAAPASPNDEQGVELALQRYRRAYERLDAKSARMVWPSVNESALGRAFDSLQSQTLIFSACEVSFRDAAAVATCEGSTRYTPRFGGREPKVEPRAWTFTLRKRGADWLIDSVKAERLFSSSSQ